MKLIPSLRQKKRYLIFEVRSEHPLSVQDIHEAVDQGLLRFLGELGLSRAGVMFLAERFDPKSQQGVLKVNHTAVDEVKAALMLIKKIKKEAVILRSVTVSGTLKAGSSRSSVSKRVI